MKHKVIGLFAVYGLYSALGLFGIYLHAGESPPQTPTAPAVARGQPGAPAFEPPGAGNFQGQFAGNTGFPGVAGGQPGGAGGVGKGGIELGPKRVFAAATPAPAPVAKNEFVNAKVEPGKVKWHADFDTACKAAAKSGRPVLLFQMMGKLDDQFC
jgi:hypothetical protein